tara:strand:+ start:382 stop:627 length:246 start_codon:yes stop_codon:yes gene_type:complete
MTDNILIDNEKFEKEAIKQWLNTTIDDNNIIFDCILDIKDKILQFLFSKDIKLRYSEDILLINLIYYMYNNSYPVSNINIS